MVYNDNCVENHLVFRLNLFELEDQISCVFQLWLRRFEYFNVMICSGTRLSVREILEVQFHPYVKNTDISFMSSQHTNKLFGVNVVYVKPEQQSRKWSIKRRGAY